MRYQQVIPTANRIEICCSSCNRMFSENEMVADLTITNRYLCQTCLDIEPKLNNSEKELNT